MVQETERTPRWRIVGPGLVVAATGVGAGDLVATLAAGSQFGYTLLWAAIAGCIMKIVLVEGAGRWTLSTGRTIFEGWRSLGPWTSVYFGPYIVIWGFVYGATAMTSSALPLATLFPDIPLQAFAIGTGLLGFVLVWFGRYHVFERIIALFVGLMFLTVVGSAVVVLPNLADMAAGLLPVIPAEEGLFYTLGLAGGVGGTITMAAYGYWLREKGWSTPRFMKVMRLDNSIAYIVTGIFVIAMLVVGAELLYSAGIAIETSDEGLIDLADVLEARYSQVWSTVFLVGFFAASFSSLLGVWNGVSLMFADFLGNLRGLESNAPRTRIGGPYFRAYLLWLTFPPMVLVFLNENPIGLVIVYGVLGALFMPFMALTLLWILNTSRVPQRWRSGWVSNVLLAVCGVLFLIVGINELIGVFE